LNYDLEEAEEALVYSRKFKELLEKEENKGKQLITSIEKAILLGLTAVTAREAEDYPLAIQYFREYIAFSEEYQVPNSLHVTFIKSMAETFQFDEEWDSALKYTYLARSFMPQNIGMPENDFTGYEGALGKLYFWKNDFVTALPLLETNYNDCVMIGEYFYAALVAIKLGDIYMKQENFDYAYQWYSEAVNNATKLYDELRLEETDTAQQVVYSGYQSMLTMNQTEAGQKYYELMVNVVNKLYRYYKAIGDADKALEQHEKQYRYKDTLNTIYQSIEERKLQVRFESERMEQQIVILEQETELAQRDVKQTRLILFVLSSILIVTLLMVLLYLRQNRLKASQDKILLQQRLFRSQLNPHFLFNSLASIQNFIVTEDADNASIYLSRFAKLVRNILDASNEEYITLEKELNIIQNYLELQKARYIDKMNYTLEVDDTLDVENLQIPPMLAQPFIENAIEHGIKLKESGGLVQVRFFKSDNYTIFEVEDNGIGREKARIIQQQRNTDHKSLATKLTLERIANLNKKHKFEITMHIIDLKDETGDASGTKVRFSIPIS
jgi:tetratricopeptide (TPR) repeat protein